MAKNTYYIVFENKDGEEQSPVAKNRQSIVTDKDEENIRALTKGLRGYASLSYAMNVVDRVVTSNVNMVSLRTGHEELQQRMQFAYSVANQGAGVLMGAIMGGSLAGGVGAVIGAVAGASDKMINMAIKQNEINVRQNIENQTLALNRIRAGAGQDRTGKTQ